MKFLHIISRKTAKEYGLKRFFLPEPCNQGHFSERNTKSSTCLECEKARKVQYRLENPEKTRASCNGSRKKYLQKHREINKKWRDKNRDYLIAAKKEYAQKNKEKVLESKKRYYQENKEKCLAASKAHKDKNSDRYRYLSRKWREENRDKVRLNNRKRKQKIKNAEGFHTVNDILELLKKQKGRCAGCCDALDGKDYHVDHIQPIALGGSNWPSNLQLMCPFCNMSKGGRPPEEFYQKRGMLL